MARVNPVSAASVTGVSKPLADDRWAFYKEPYHAPAHVSCVNGKSAS